jgi:AraC-like DNA-binding protein
MEGENMTHRELERLMFHALHADRLERKYAIKQVMEESGRSKSEVTRVFNEVMETLMYGM